MRSASARVFISDFFTARDAQRTGTESLSLFPDDSQITESFLLRMCSAHGLLTTAQLHAFLLTEESYLRRLAAKEAAAEARAPYAMAAPLVSPPNRTIRRKRMRDDGAPDACGDDVYNQLVAALNLWFLTDGHVGVSATAASSPALRSVFSSLLELQLQRQQQHSPDSIAPTFPFTNAQLFPRRFTTGCPEVDRIIGTRPRTSAWDTAATQGGDTYFASIHEEMALASHASTVLAELSGGFSGGRVTELSGEAGTGKTLIVLQTALMYIVQKIAAGVICSFFAGPTEDDDDSDEGDDENADADACHSDVEPPPDAPKGTSNLYRYRRRSLWPYRACIEHLLSALNHGESYSRPGASLATTLRVTHDHTSGICALYLASELVPAARFDSVASGCAARLQRQLRAFFAPLLPSAVLQGLVTALQRQLRVEAVLEGLRVSTFSTLEELRRMMEGPLRCVLSGVQEALRTKPSHTKANAVAAERVLGPLGGGILIIDSVAAAAMETEARTTAAASASEPKQAGSNDREGGSSRRHTVLEIVGTLLRQVALERDLCVLVTNQVRSRVMPRRGSGSEVGLMANPLMRLRQYQGILQAMARAPVRPTAVGIGRAGVETVGLARAHMEAAQVPALGLRWALVPHERVFLQKLPTIKGSLNGAISMRTLTLVSSPAAAPATVEYAITRDGMCVPTEQEKG